MNGSYLCVFPPLGSMVMCDYLWLLVVIHGYLWLSCGYPWLSVVICGFPLLYMVIGGYIWL